MRTLSIPFTLLLVALSTAPAAGQAIPDWIPDEPGESPADRAQERLEERFRGTLSRFFTTGAFDLAPFTAEGLSYQGSVDLGMTFSSGDAIFLFASSRRMPGVPGATDPRQRIGGTAWYGGVGYEVSGLRFMAPSELARRSSLNLGAGLMQVGELQGAVLEIAPTYKLIEGPSWSVPVGLKLSIDAFGTDLRPGTLDPFFGLSIGVRHHFGERGKLRSRYDADSTEGRDP